MDPLHIRTGTTISPRCAECGTGIAAFEVDGTRDRLCYRCVGEYVALPVPMTLGDITRRLQGEEITESERRLMDGNR